MSTGYRLQELAARVGGEVEGDPDRTIRGLATLDRAGADELAFFTNPRYRRALDATRAGAVLVGPESGLSGRDLLVARRPYAALAVLLELFHPAQAPAPGVSDDARIGRDVELGRDVHVGPFAVLGDGCVLGDGVVVGAGSVIGEACRIGAGSAIRPRVVLYPGTRVGERCLIHSGVVLGADGFGFATVDGEHRKLPQVGRVVIEDDVEIGANTTVDRAMLGETRVGAGSKIDDLVMLAHGVRIGPASLLVAQSGVAGSARLGRAVTLAGQSGVAGHLELGDGTVVASKSAVFDDLPAGSFVGGVPAFDQRRWRRAATLFKRLPELRRELRSLQARVAELERARDGEG